MKERQIEVLPEALQSIKSGENTQIVSCKGLDLINEDPKNWSFSHYARDLDPYGRLIAIFHGIKKPVTKSIGIEDKDFIIKSLEGRRLELNKELSRICEILQRFYGFKKYRTNLSATLRLKNFDIARKITNRDKPVKLKRRNLLKTGGNQAKSYANKSTTQSGDTIQKRKVRKPKR